MPIQQVEPHEYFPSGDRYALVEIRFDPTELAERYGLVFEELYDDLDWFELAAIALPDGAQAWLIKYRGEQDAGTTVYIDAGSSLNQAKHLVLQTLGLTDDDLLWVTPGAEAQQVSA